MSLFDDLPEPTAENSLLATEKVKADTPSATEPNSIADEVVVEAPIRFISAAIARKGERPEMQDAHTIVENLLIQFRTPPSSEVERLSYFAVFDGHGGARAAEFAAKRLHLHLVARFPKGGVKQIDKDIRRVVYDAYKKTDEDFLREAIQQRPHWRDGSTAATAVLVNNTLYVANLGDSKIVLARVVSGNNEAKVDSNASLLGVTSALCLTRDHNPIDYEERQRIQAAGASVQNGRVNNILEVSRSFGDYQFKKQGVTCIPDVRKCQLTSRDKFLLIACDGLWKSFPPSEAVTMIDELLHKEISMASRERESLQKIQAGCAEQPTSNCLLTQRRVEAVCTQIVNEAVLRMSGDNVTCILIVFPDAFVATPEQHPAADNPKHASPGTTHASHVPDEDEPLSKMSRHA